MYLNLCTNLKLWKVVENGADPAEFRPKSNIIATAAGIQKRRVMDWSRVFSNHLKSTLHRNRQVGKKCD